MSTVQQLYLALQKEVIANRGDEEVYADVMSRDEPASLYVGDDENADPIGDVTLL